MIIGNNKNHHRLARSYQEDRLHHCLIFEGPVGTGKSEFAFWMVKLLLCDQPVSTDSKYGTHLSPCLSCWQCRALEREEHPDFIRIGLDPTKKTPIISVDQARGLISDLRLHTARARNRVVVIEPAEKMKFGDSQCSSKNFEEPPPNTFFLICTSVHQLITTVRSRAQRVRFQPVTFWTEEYDFTEELVRTLQEPSRGYGRDWETGSKHNRSLRRKVSKRAQGEACSTASERQAFLELVEPGLDKVVNQLIVMSDSAPYKALELAQERLEGFRAYRDSRDEMLAAMRGGLS